jgi:FixJ family two-component response regulator
LDLVCISFPIPLVFTFAWMTPRGRRVFVIDDDRSVCRGLARLLTAADFRVETFDSGRSFLKRTPPKGEHCLVVDVRMPGMSGPALRDELRDRGRASPIVFMTAHGTDEIEEDLGMETVLLKPIEADMLVRAVDAAINNSGEYLGKRPPKLRRRGNGG